MGNDAERLHYLHATIRPARKATVQHTSLKNVADINLISFSSDLPNEIPEYMVCLHQTMMHDKLLYMHQSHCVLSPARIYFKFARRPQKLCILQEKQQLLGHSQKLEIASIANRL